jgi:predicted acetylornithine/succinylornithine family transaminase
VTPDSAGAHTFEAVADLTSRFVVTTYGRRPVAFVRGKGARLWDTEGREYLDFVAGLAVCILGHAHPKVTKAIRQQAGTLLHTSNLYHIPLQARLAERLAGLSGGMQSFFCNSGGEAMEAALKLARKWAHVQRGLAEPEVISALNSFHGRTYGALTLTGQEKYQKNFGPLLPGIRYARFNDLDDFAAHFNERTTAAVLEVLQGEGGVYEANEEFLRGVEALCRRFNALLILDEVQTGMARTGTFFAFQQYGLSPDIVTLAKGLAGGVPIGAMLAKPEVARTFQPGDHASTFGGNFLACAAALATLDVVEQKRLPQRAARLGRALARRINAFKRAGGPVASQRGRGLLRAVQLARPLAKQVEAECLARGLLVNAVQEDAVRLLPPLTISPAELRRGLDILEEAIRAVFAKEG